MNIQTSASQRLYSQAKYFLGKDASPLNLVPKAVECAESVSYITRSIWPTFPMTTGTYTLLMEVLPKSLDFVPVKTPQPGDIYGYATGTGNGEFPGHVGIVGDELPNGDRYVMSNNSLSGIFDTHQTISSMRARYRDEARMPEQIFRRITN